VSQPLRKWRCKAALISLYADSVFQVGRSIAMSAAVCSSFSNPSQLYFDWMHEDESSRTVSPTGTVSHGSRSHDHQLQNRLPAHSSLHRGFTKVQARGIGRGNWPDVQQPARRCSTASPSTPQPNSTQPNSTQSNSTQPNCPQLNSPQIANAARKERTGEVRLGDVMLKLLKRYGITDEEIAAALAPDCPQIQ